MIPRRAGPACYARRGTTGSVYLDVEYTVLEGPYAKRKIWSMIGLYSASGPNWGQHGPQPVRGILNSARVVLSDRDNSPEGAECPPYFRLRGSRRARVRGAYRHRQGQQRRGQERHPSGRDAGPEGIRRRHGGSCGAHGCYAPAPLDGGSAAVLRAAAAPAAVLRVPRPLDRNAATPAAGVRPTWAK